MPPRVESGHPGHGYDSACPACRLLMGLRVLARLEQRLSASASSSWPRGRVERVMVIAEDVTSMACMLLTPDGPTTGSTVARGSAPRVGGDA